ncbi:hypothetical protein NUU61_001574 [Penicillium alfredii]|uniref:Uncharacterized protein n=1 Tax=Penicillium alfredii TaxID=1506179 RepID=A0A9W9G3W3_9EURO|nr:uncharacterized protein NUU61_001299 [Penicillium alfredii]XP_056515423.1 uncharacterized protein NUU61_001574 [Penicillium alfredii]KAJ5111669.1 hypothetical protein NUU61_001299 [Penicillium alfredii]KAJ5111944.1 hypothetical protein NUU61_001574 [Penicillium alfredii]
MPPKSMKHMSTQPADEVVHQDDADHSAGIPPGSQARPPAKRTGISSTKPAVAAPRAPRGSKKKATPPPENDTSAATQSRPVPSRRELQTIGEKAFEAVLVFLQLLWVYWLNLP